MRSSLFAWRLWNEEWIFFYLEENMRKEENAFLINSIPHYFNETMKRIICGTMAVLMVVASALPVKRVQASSYETVDATETTTDTEPVDYATTEDADFDVSQVDILGEVEDLRTLDTKTFMREDGTFVTAIYGEPVHYLSDGKYLDIDNTLSLDPETNVYSTKANAFGVRFPESLDSGKPIQLTYGEYSIGWILTGTTKSTSAQVADTKVSEDPKVLTKVDQSVTYFSVMDGVDVEYIVTGNSVKENIVLNRLVENFSLSFTYSLGNLSLVLQDDGTYSFTDENGKAVFDFASLYMFDAEGKDSQNIKMTVTENEKRQYIVTIVPDSEWLKTAVFPVTIDPTISSATTTMTFHDTYVCQDNPSTQTYYNYSYFYVANGSLTTNKRKGLLRFVLPSLSGKTITYAYLSLTKADTYTAQRVIELHNNNGTFSESTVTWNTAPSYSSNVVDYKVVENGSGTKFVFDITEYCQSFANGLTSNLGFTILDHEGTGNYTRFYSSEHTALMPVVEVGYVNTEGLKDYWTYSSQSAGYAGTGYVSDYSGFMTFVREDLSFSTDKQSLGLSFAYSVLSRSTDVGYGLGWNIIYNTRILYDSTLGLYYSKDYTGNIVYFHQQSSYDSRISPTSPEVDVTYIAEDGSGDVYVRQFAYGALGGQYVLTADNIRYSFGTDSYLDEMTNLETGCCVTISRNPSALDQVTQVTDISGNKIVLIYTSSKLSSASLYIKQPDASFNLLEQVLYSDTDSITGFSPTRVEYVKDYVTTDQLLSSDVAFITYDSSYRLTAAYVEDMEHITYSYTTGNKVDSLTSLFGTSLFSLIDYNYSFKVTTITDQSGNYVINKFDDYGHTINIIDNYGNVQTRSYMNLFNNRIDDPQTGIYTLSDGSPNYSNNHKVVSESAPEARTFNPINNPGFEYDVLQTEASWNLVVDYHEGGGDVLSAYSRDDEHFISGSHSGELMVLSSDQIHIEQTVVLDAGTYVLTGYAKNDTISNTGIFVDVVGEDNPGTTVYIPSGGEWTYFEISFGILTDGTEVDIWLAAHAVGYSYFDNIQLLEGFVDTRANMVDNPSFEVVDANGDLGFWTMNDSANVTRVNTTALTDDLYESILGQYGMKITGSATQTRWMNTLLSQFFDMSRLAQEGQLVIGAWAYSNGTPTTVSSIDLSNGNPRFFRIRVDFLLNFTVLESQYINFDTSVEGWQYVYGRITTPDEYFNYARVYLEYQGMGDVYFDGLQVFFEQSFTNYQYNEHGQVTRIQTSEGDVTEYTYPDVDYPAKPTAIALTDGTSVDIQTDSWSAPVNEVTYNEVGSTPTYNVYGQVTQMKVGNTSTYFSTSTTYTHLSQYVLATTDEYGKSTQYTNDYLTGLLTAIENAKGQDTHYLYDNAGNLIEVRSVEEYTDPETGTDAKVIYMYDELDRLDYIVLDTNFNYHISYDSQGRMSGVSVNNTPLMTYTYEMDGGYYTGLLSTQTYGNGDAIQFVYDEQDRVSAIQFKNSGSSTYVTQFGYKYDQAGRIAIYETYDNGVVVNSEFYTYDSSGNLRMVTDTEGNKTEYIYDGSGNLTSLHFEIDGESATTNYTYNECFIYEGSTCTQTSSFYDKTNYSTESSIAVVKDYHYETSALYRLDYILLSIGAYNIKQDFTFLGNTTRITDISYDFTNNGTVEFKYSYIYDELGNIVQESYYELVSSVLTLKVQKYYEYDVLNQLIIEDNYTVGTGTYSTIYSYGDGGNRTSVYQYFTTSNLAFRTAAPTVPTANMTNYGSRTVIPYYNSIYSYSTIKSIEVGQVYPSLTFRYLDDSTGLYYSAATGIISTNYDSLRKGFYSASYHAYSSTYGIDVYFNIRFNVGNMATSAGTSTNYSTYVYDDAWLDQLESYATIINGVSTNHVLTYDAQGNPTQITNVSYKGTVWATCSLAWDGRQLKSINFSTAYGPAYMITYQYNDQGYRTSKSSYHFSWATPPGFVLDQMISYQLIDDKVVYETDGIYGILFTYDYDGTLISFNYDSNVNDSTAGTEYFYLRNQQGDITMISDVSGNVVMKYSYDAYGNVTCSPTSGYTDLTAINPYTYRGYRFDSETGMFYLNSRYYNPQIGRFLNGDGLLGEPGTISSTNMYAYCESNPINKKDESGFFWNIIAGAAIGFVVGFGFSLISQAISGNSPDLSKALVSGVAGAITGGLAATGLGWVGQTIANGVVSGAETLVNQLIDGQGIDLLEIGISVGAGCISGLIGGKGFKADKGFSNAMKSFTKVMEKASRVGGYATLRGCKSALTQVGNKLIREMGRNLTVTTARYICGNVVGDAITTVYDFFKRD